ncbi:hypothetical protein [Delftia sp.]|uniref:hypothetical protein n=1 Tax=Delftia sp. TaxID=1886637 RepID=UPI00259D001A|nr:hypothetical protein [Delftia sp.]
MAGLSGHLRAPAELWIFGADKLGRVFNQQGSYFLEYAIEKWPQIVAQAAKEMEAGKK